MQDFLNQVFAAIAGFGGMPMVLKISSIVLLVIASMKVTPINQLIWSKLGGAQAFLAPILGLVAGLLGVAGHVPLTWASAFAYLSAGAGAIILHELLDACKAIPGLGSLYVSAINLIESFLNPQNPPSLK